MPTLRTCDADGCDTKTLGPLCLEHESEVVIRLAEARHGAGGATAGPGVVASVPAPASLPALAGGWRCYLPPGSDGWPGGSRG